MKLSVQWKQKWCVSMLTAVLLMPVMSYSASAATDTNPTSQTTAVQTSLPNIKILATGGTIAGSSESNTDVTGYKAGALGIDVLINAVPEMKK